MQTDIRREIGEDQRRIEEITREAFWNLYIPGCIEHYLVHIMRNHEDFIPKLDFVALGDDELVGNIMFTRSWLVDEEGTNLEIATFGPVSVLPAHQRRGIGAALIRHSIEKAKEMGVAAIVIYGNPHNYCRYGFKSARDFNIANREGKHPYAMLALELREGTLDSHSWTYRDSDVFNFKVEDAEAFDTSFEAKERGFSWTQEEFSMSCRAFIE